MKEEREESNWRAWFLVASLALLFLIYGISMILFVGDKGPPPWDFGTVEDIPGQSVYSTAPSVGGAASVPEPQHVSQKPPRLPEEKP